MQTQTEIGYNTKIEGDVIVTRVDAALELVPQKFRLADADGPGLLRHRIDGRGREPV